jgi:hypothetical protein
MTIINLDKITIFECDLDLGEAVILAKMDDELDIDSATYLVLNFLTVLGQDAFLKNYNMYGHDDLMGYIIKFEIRKNNRVVEKPTPSKN